jgi:branched-subunit amino acid transport protein
MLLPDGQHWQLSFENAYLLAGIAAIGIAAFSRNLLATIGGGLAVFFVLRWMMGQI